MTCANPESLSGSSSTRRRTYTTSVGAMLFLTPEANIGFTSTPRNILNEFELSAFAFLWKMSFHFIVKGFFIPTFVNFKSTNNTISTLETDLFLASCWCFFTLQTHSNNAFNRKVIRWTVNLCVELERLQCRSKSSK